MNYPRASELQLSCGPDAVNRLSGTILLVAYEEGALEKSNNLLQPAAFLLCAVFQE